MSSQSMTPTPPSFGSDAFLKGTFGILPGLEEWAEAFHEDLADAVEDTKAKLRTEIRAAAASTPGWKQFEDIIDVEFEDGEFHFILSGPPAKVDAAYDLEYGTPDRPPRMLLRKHALAIREAVVTEIAKPLNEGVPVA